MKLKFVKLIRVPISVEMSDGISREGYRYMDIDGKIIAESLKGEVYPSAIREMEAEIEREAKAEKAKAQEKAEEKAKQEQIESEAQAEWDAIRAKMKEQLEK